MENRIIKFRGKRIDNGEWVFGYYSFNPFFKRAQIFVYGDVRSYVYEVIPESVGQLVLNIGGKEYYEGDIVKAHKKGANFPLNYIIVFNEEELAYKMRWTGRAKEDGFYDEKIGIGGFNTFDAIGNLHDNPELITDKVK